MRPSSIPSVPPTQSSVPTDLPSYLPTNYPTKVPSSEPTDIPSAPPTLGIKEVTEKLIHMTLEGLEELTDEEQKEWEDMTSHHVFRYFDELNDSLPGLAPINITKVETTFIGQSSATRPELGPARSLQDRPVLGIDYTQTIYFGVWDEDLNEEDINWYIFIAPFEYDSQSYLIDLIEQWELENWVDLLSVEVGQASESPSQTPTDAPPSDGERNVSRGAIGTSIGIVVFACLVVCALLYDRYRNEERYRQARAQMNMENIEDVGPQMDWKNPNCIVVDSSNGAHPDPQDVRARQDQSGKGSRHRRNRSRDSLRSSNQGNGSRHSRDSLGLPPLPPGITAISPLPPGSPHDRHVSDVTEVSYLSGSRSDNGSDDNPLLMPMDERYVLPIHSNLSCL